MEKTSRINKYKDLRKGIKDEVGVSREPVKQVLDEEDDFLSFISKNGNKKETFDDTLVEAKTYEQMKKESNEDLEKALRSVKNKVGKEEAYNTRMDIMNKIRNPEKVATKTDSMDHANKEELTKEELVTEVNKEVEPIKKPTEETISEKKAMTLMERLAKMSPKEDAKKLEGMELPKEVEEVEENEIALEDSIKEKLARIKEKDQKEVEKALSEKAESNQETEIIDLEETKSTKKTEILNYVMIALEVGFILLCAMILFQLF